MNNIGQCYHVYLLHFFLFRYKGIKILFTRKLSAIKSLVIFCDNELDTSSQDSPFIIRCTAYNDMRLFLQSMHGHVYQPGQTMNRFVSFSRTQSRVPSSDCKWKGISKFSATPSLNQQFCSITLINFLFRIDAPKRAVFTLISQN